MTLGQTFSGFASILEDEIKHLNEAAADFLTVNMGATAIGTGICAEPGYAEKCVAALCSITGLEFKPPDDLGAPPPDTSCLVGYASAMKRVAVKMNKISQRPASPRQRPALRSRRVQPAGHAARQPRSCPAR